MSRIQHDTWTIERTYAARRTEVFAAWADVEVKRRWFVGPDGEPNDDLSMDFRVGGAERTHGTTAAGDRYSYDAQYCDIVPDERIITMYVMVINDRRISVSMASVELTDEDGGTRLVYTEQGAYLDGLDDPASRRGGVASDLDSLGDFLAQTDGP